MSCRTRPFVGLVVFLSFVFLTARDVSAQQPPCPCQELSGGLDVSVGDDGSYLPTTGDFWVDAAPNSGYFLQYDRLYWSIPAPDVTVIGDPSSEGLITTPDGVSYNLQNSLDTSWLESEFAWGDRVDFGCVEDGHGWIVSVLHVRQRQSLSANGVNFVPADDDGLLAGYADGNADAVDDDLDGDHVFGRNGADLGTPDGNTPPGFVLPYDGTPDAAAPVDPDDMAFWLVTFGTLQATNITEMTGVEWMGVSRNWQPGNTSYWEWYYGVRYLQIKDTFAIDGSGGFLDPSYLNTEAKNDIVGPQIGLRWNHDVSYVTFAVEGRFVPGVNFQRAVQTGHVATNATPGGQNGPVALAATAFNSTLTDERFAPVGELRVETIYKVNPWFGFRLGYTGLIAGGISRASEKVEYELPYFGISNRASHEALFSNALTFGLELNR